MNKQELIELMMDKTGLTRSDCGITLDGLLCAVTETLQAGEKVKLSGFGCFAREAPGSENGAQPADERDRGDPGAERPRVQSGQGTERKHNRLTGNNQQRGQAPVAPSILTEQHPFWQTEISEL